MTVRVPLAGKEFLCDFPPSAMARKELCSLRESKCVLVPPVYGVTLLDFSVKFDWSSHAELSPTFHWWLNSFFCLRPLLIEMGREESDIELAASIMRDWASDNDPSTPSSKMAWDGHATAIRAEHLAALYVLGCHEQWLIDTIAVHAEMLLDEDFHQGKWNHGLDQDIGLLALGCALDRDDWKRLAYERALDNLEASIDVQGVTHEQAVGYQYYVYLRFNDLKTRLDASGLAVDESKFSRLPRMLDFAAHGVAPDGNWVQLGDTLLRNAHNDATDLARFASGSALEYAATNGARGERPDRRIAIFDSGYVFGRSGWGEERPFEQESYYTLRFGPGRIIHGHNDHTSLTYHYKGRRVLIDGGFHGYSDEKMRKHLQTPEAHNTVVSLDNANFLWNAKTELTYSQVREDWQSYQLRDVPYYKTTRQRGILFCQDPEFIVVVDRLVSEQSRPFQQLWHFDRGLELRSLTRDHAELTLGDAKAECFQLWPFDEISYFRGCEQPLRGWAGYGHDEIVPVPTLATVRSGKFVTFLTVFGFAKHSEKVSVSQSASKNSRLMTVSIGNKSRSVLLQEDGTMQVKD